MTVINRHRNRLGFLFGSGADGDVTISADTDLPSTLNGDIVERNYRNLTINSGCTLSVSNMCQGLWIRVRGTLTLNGNISMSNKGCFLSGGGSDLFIVFSDIKIPSLGAAGGIAVNSQAGTNGANGTNGQCGGGGSGGSCPQDNALGGNGAAGFVGGGGCGGGGAALAYAEGVDYKVGNPGLAYGQKGGDSVHAHKAHNPGDDNWIIADGWGGGGAGGVTPGAAVSGDQPVGVGSGGILIVLANSIVGNGNLLADGARGGDGLWGQGAAYGSGGGGSGGGSIVVMYASAATINMRANGGAGGEGTYLEGDGGAGGNGSLRTWSIAQLASHTRI